MKFFANNSHGFTLLEVVIALAIFSISIVGLYAVQTRTIGQNFTASRITTAVTWASEKIEDLISLDYDDISDSVGGGETSPDGVYTITWNVVDEAPLPNTKTINMVVTSQRAGTGSLVQLEYIKHKND
ncbi:MAG: prepilin-type N-terminal cleavage/methylation domain-containing protein [Desulforhopalus sp.]|jgi:prepilin-type N-terminal cleavage/methylation domain-containing protein